MWVKNERNLVGKKESIIVEDLGNKINSIYNYVFIESLVNIFCRVLELKDRWGWWSLNFIVMDEERL